MSEETLVARFDDPFFALRAVAEPNVKLDAPEAYCTAYCNPVQSACNTTATRVRGGRLFSTLYADLVIATWSNFGCNPC